MAPETEKYFDNYRVLFNTEGWKQLTQELSQNSLTINSVVDTKDEKDLCFRKGQLNVIGYILNLHQTIEAAYEDAAAEGLDAEDI